MALNIGDPRAWLAVSDYFYNTTDPIAPHTGFMGYSGPGVHGNVPSVRSAFTDGETDSPVYDAMTASLRSAMPGLARKARTGDVSAVAGYQQAYAQLQDDDYVYGIARGHNLNDVNSSDLVRAVREASPYEALGTGTRQYRENLADYLAAQAVQRGEHVRNLGVSEQMLDDTFRTSFLGALAGGSRVSPVAEGLKTRFESSPGMLMNSSLQLRRGLADWERNNGLRSDSMRANILTKAAEYYARSMSVDGLNRFTQDTATIIQAAAEAAGATAGVVKENVFDAYNNAVASLDGIVTYSGFRDQDLVADGQNSGGTRTAAVQGIKSAYAGAIGRNLAAGRGAWDNDAETDAQLTQDLRTVIDHIAVGARSHADYTTVRDDVVGRIKAMGTAGSIDISSLLDLYDTPGSQQFTVPKAMPGADVLGSIADQAMKDLVQDRSYFALSFSGFEPEYTRAGIDRYLDTVLAKADVGQDLKDAVKSTISEFIYNVNNKTDSTSVSADEVDSYTKGLKERVNAIAAAFQLRDLGIIPEAVIPVSTPSYRGGEWEFFLHRASELQAGNRSNARNTYGPLLDAVNAYVDGVSVEKLADPADVYKFHLATKVVEGIRNTIDAAYDGDDLVKKAKASMAKSSGDMMVTNGLAGAYAAAEALTQAELKQRLMKEMGAGTKVSTLGNIVSSMMSDTLDPVFARRAQEYTATKLNAIGGKYLSGTALASYTKRYTPAVLMLMRRAFPEGFSSEEWNNPGSFDARMSELVRPLFQTIEEHVAAVRQAAKDEFEQRQKIAQKVRDQ